MMGEMGFLGMMVDPKYGGGGMDTLSYALAMEEISKIDASTSVIMSVNNSLVCYGIEKYADEEQKQKYLTQLATGEKLGAFCLSEPEAGSDATSQKTTAIDKGDYYLLNGTKNWITNGNSADYYIVIAQTASLDGTITVNPCTFYNLDKQYVVLACKAIISSMDIAKNNEFRFIVIANSSSGLVCFCYSFL